MFWRDLAERTAATYAQALAGLLILNWTDTLDLSILSVAAWAAIPAALAVVKGAAAKFVGDPDSASLVPDVGGGGLTNGGGVHPKDPPQDVVPLPERKDE